MTDTTTDTMTDTTPVRLVGIAIDAAAPHDLARFWSQALRWTVRDGPNGEVELVPTDDTGFGVVFRPSPEEKVGQNRIHFDLTTTSIDDQNDTVAGLLTIAATHIDIGQRPDEGHVVLADPEGNELCIIEPHNQFLADCPRLGAVNCDGTSELGHFYSRALGWPLVWDQDEETAIRAADGTGPKITWSGPPLMPKFAEQRFHMHLAPTPGTATVSALDHLLGLGAAIIDGDSACPDAIALTDVDGNEFCLLLG